MFSLKEKLPTPKKIWKGFTSNLRSKLLCFPKPRRYYHHHVHYYQCSHCYDQGFQTQKTLPSPTVYADRVLTRSEAVQHRYLIPKVEEGREKPVLERKSDERESNDEAEAETQQPAGVTETKDHDEYESEYDDAPAEDDLEDEDENEYDLVQTFNSMKLRLSGVDAKAEKFIMKFYEGLKIESQKSIQEFYDMLERSA